MRRTAKTNSFVHLAKKRKERKERKERKVKKKPKKTKERKREGGTMAARGEEGGATTVSHREQPRAAIVAADVSFVPYAFETCFSHSYQSQPQK